MVALAPSFMLITPLPPAPPPLKEMMLFLMVTFWAVIWRPPVMFSQLITVPGVLIVMVRVVEPLFAVSAPPGHWERSGPVFAGPGQPHASRLCQTAFWQSMAAAPPAKTKKANVHKISLFTLYTPIHSWRSIIRRPIVRVLHRPRKTREPLDSLEPFGLEHRPEATSLFAPFLGGQEGRNAFDLNHCSDFPDSRNGHSPECVRNRTMVLK